MTAAGNHLIALLPRAQRLSLLKHCEPVELLLSQVLCEPGQQAQHAYFPTQAFISVVALLDGRPSLEVGMVGNEGMLGAHLALGVSTVPLHALVQGKGQALRVGAVALRRELAHSPALLRVLQRYVYVLMDQLASTAACLRFHQVGPRLARWLLMTQDRAHSDQFQVTHEFLAYMLGVRRVSVTLAAQELQGRGLIRYHRGQVIVLERAALEAAACGCYAADQASYVRML